MKPAAFAYVRPRSVDEAVAALAEHGEEAKVLAGGQSLVPLLNMRLARPTVLVDINRVLELDNVDRRDGVARVGALVRQSAFAGVSELADQCLPHVGHFVTRNRGTVGGSIAHADASAELPLALLTCGGSAVAVSARGRREIAADDLFVTHFTTALEPDELLVETLWPATGPACAFEEFALRHGDYALAMAACVLRVDDGRVAEARVGVGSVTDRPTLLDIPLAGERLTPALAREAGEAAAMGVDPPATLHGSAEYRRQLTRVLVERVVARAWSRTGRAEAA